MRPLTALLLPLLLCSVTAACRSSSQVGSATAGTAISGDPRLAGRTPPPEHETARVEPSSPKLPIEPDDGVWGEALAPVTVVVFTDLECPYCSQGHRVLTDLERRYGEQSLRVVIKHLPLARHAGAVPAARVAQAVLALGGRRKFFEYLDRAFADQEAIAFGRALEVAAPLGFEPEQLRAKAASAAIGAEVLRDVAVADRVGVPGTPHFRINGLAVTGARPVESLARLIDAELNEAARLRQAGVLANAVYARRVNANSAKPEPEL